MGYRRGCRDGTDRQNRSLGRERGRHEPAHNGPAVSERRLPSEMGLEMTELRHAIGLWTFTLFWVVFGGVVLWWAHLAAQTVQSGNPSPGPVGVISANVAVCDPYNPNNCLTPAATTNIISSGTTGAVTGTMPGVTTLTNYLCSIDIEANGSGVVSPLTVTGIFSGSIQLFAVITAPTSYQKTWTPCLPAHSAGSSIQITTTADATASAVEVIVSGFTH